MASMTFFIREFNCSAREFKTKEEFLKAITDLVDIYEQQKAEWVEIEVDAELED